MNRVTLRKVTFGSVAFQPGTKKSQWLCSRVTRYQKKGFVPHHNPNFDTKLGLWLFWLMSPDNVHFCSCIVAHSGYASFFYELCRLFLHAHIYTIAFFPPEIVCLLNCFAWFWGPSSGHMILRMVIRYSLSYTKKRLFAAKRIMVRRSFCSDHDFDFSPE